MPEEWCRTREYLNKGATPPRSSPISEGTLNLQASKLDLISDSLRVYSAFALEGFDTKIGRVDDLKKYRIGVVADARATYLRQRGFTTLIE